MVSTLMSFVAVMFYYYCKRKFFPDKKVSRPTKKKKKKKKSTKNTRGHLGAIDEDLDEDDIVIRGQERKMSDDRTQLEKCLLAVIQDYSTFLKVREQEKKELLENLRDITQMHTFMQLFVDFIKF